MGTTNRASILGALAAMMGLSTAQMGKAVAHRPQRPDPDKKDNKRSYSAWKYRKANAPRPRFSGHAEIARRVDQLRKGMIASGRA